MNNDEKKPRRKKWFLIVIGGFVALCLLILFASIFTTWAENGGDVVGVLETTRTLKNGSSFIQALLLFFLWWNWEDLIVKNKKTNSQTREVLSKSKNPICGYAFLLLLIFWLI